MSNIMTPALASIERGDILPEQALRYADHYLEWIEGIDPILAFSDSEINRHHRALALGQLAYMNQHQPVYLSNPDEG